MWYEVVTNKDGSAASCELKSESIRNGKNVWYVEADSKAEAIQKAKALWLERYERHHKSKLEANRKAVLKAIAAGLCGQCKKNPLSSRTRCRTCLDRMAGPRKPRVQKTEQEKAEAARRNSEKTIQNARLRPLRLLQKVLNEFRSLSPERFEGWLVSQIHELESKNRHAQPQAAE